MNHICMAKGIPSDPVRSDYALDERLRQRAAVWSRTTSPLSNCDRAKWLSFMPQGSEFNPIGGKEQHRPNSPDQCGAGKS